MARVEAGGFGAVAGEIEEPLQGAWTARLELDLDTDDGEAAIESGAAITITFYDDADAVGAEFVGTVTRGEVYSGRWVGRVVGGAGGLDTAVDAKYYTDVTAQTVVTDLVGEGGEVLSTADSDSSVTGSSLERWHRAQGTVKRSLRVLTTELAATWRVGRNGEVVLKSADADYPEVVADYDLVGSNPSQNKAEIAPDAVPFVSPGLTFAGKRVGHVTTTWGASGIRQEVVFEDGDGTSAAKPRGAAAQLADTMRKASEEAINYSQMYPATVVKQDGNELEVDPDDARIKGRGITKVPMRHGVPGLTVTVKVGERVCIFFEDGKPSKPAAALWPDGSSVDGLAFAVGGLALEMAGDAVNITATTVTINGALNVTGEVTANSESAPVGLSTHLHPHPMGPTSPPTPGT